MKQKLEFYQLSLGKNSALKSEHLAMGFMGNLAAFSQMEPFSGGRITIQIPSKLQNNSFGVIFNHIWTVPMQLISKLEHIQSAIFIDPQDTFDIAATVEEAATTNAELENDSKPTEKMINPL